MLLLKGSFACDKQDLTGKDSKSVSGVLLTSLLLLWSRRKKKRSIIPSESSHLVSSRDSLAIPVYVVAAVCDAHSYCVLLVLSSCAVAVKCIR